MLYIVPVKF